MSFMPSSERRKDGRQAYKSSDHAYMRCKGRNRDGTTTGSGESSNKLSGEDPVISGYVRRLCDRAARFGA